MQLSSARYALIAAEKDLERSSITLLSRQKHRLELLQQRIADTSPEKLLSRGYSITLKEGKAVTDRSTLKSGDELITRLYKGEVTSIVT